LLSVLAVLALVQSATGVLDWCEQSHDPHFATGSPAFRITRRAGSPSVRVSCSPIALKTLIFILFFPAAVGVKKSPNKFYILEKASRRCCRRIYLLKKPRTTSATRWICVSVSSG
jgi:hypothetical protein